MRAPPSRQAIVMARWRRPSAVRAGSRRLRCAMVASTPACCNCRSSSCACMYSYMGINVCNAHTQAHQDSIHIMYTGSVPGDRPQLARVSRHCRRHHALVLGRTQGASSCASLPSPTRQAAPCLRPCHAPRQYESNRGRIPSVAACRRRRCAGPRGCPRVDASVSVAIY